ncbi:hypothetical protein ACET3Z_001661 [Daucus carota]
MVLYMVSERVNGTPLARSCDHRFGTNLEGSHESTPFGFSFSCLLVSQGLASSLTVVWSGLLCSQLLSSILSHIPSAF